MARATITFTDSGDGQNIAVKMKFTPELERNEDGSDFEATPAQQACLEAMNLFMESRQPQAG